MNFDEYDRRAKAVAIYPGQGTIAGLNYAALGLGGESGEFLDQMKRIWRDDLGILETERLDKMEMELGDALWYLAACARELGSSIGRIAELNLLKLESRKDRGVVHGQGDNR
jgi:NTP pyrophosphatase (non-canonical NTP hydrolase)